jgi:endonuclease YncB( thermonuclease family)
MLAVLGATLFGCSIPGPPAVAPDLAEPWPTVPLPRRTPLPMLEALPLPDTRTPTPTRGPEDFIGRQRVKVLRVWDGQTVLVENGLLVRYLGIAAPGGGVLGRPLEALGRDAAVRNVELVEGKEVELEQDVTNVDADGRLPRYVYADGEFVNAALVRAGLAHVGAASPDARHRDLLLEAEREAAEARRGVWAAGPTMTVTPRPVPTPRPAAPAAPAAPPPTGTPASDRSQAPTLGPAAPAPLATAPAVPPPTVAPANAPPTARVVPTSPPPPPAAPVPPPAVPAAPRFGD